MNEIVNLCYLLSNEKKLKFSTKNDTRLERKCSLDIHAPIFFFALLKRYLNICTFSFEHLVKRLFIFRKFTRLGSNDDV